MLPYILNRCNGYIIGGCIMLVDYIFSKSIKIKSQSTKSTNSYLEKPSHISVTLSHKVINKVGLYGHIRSGSGHFFLTNFFSHNQMSTLSGLDLKKIVIQKF